jgi:DNA-binding NtrC family response regulator
MPPLRDRGTDILLLFRLFALQMAEKYNLPKITLTDEAKQIMLAYKWPGNVRQLKNITEQMSVLSEERVIDAKTLRQFIPQDPESMQLAPVNHGGSHSYESEREILYKILYELRGNISDLRRDMNSLRKQMDDNSSIISATNNMQAMSNPTIAYQPSTEDAIAEEIKEPETLNLSDLGRQMVEKALERNGGNRKKAAQELGISDRTLYRKLKQYGLDNK